MTSDPLSRFLAQRTVSRNTRTRLKPMKPGEVTDMSIRVYQELGGIILRHTAIPTLMTLTAVLFVTNYVLPSFLQTTHKTNISFQLAEVCASLAIGVLVAGPLYLLGLSYSACIICSLVADYMNGWVPDPKKASTVARSSLRKMFGLTVIELVFACGPLLVGLLLLMFSALASQIWSDPNSAAPAVITMLAVIALVISFFAVPFALARYSLAAPIIAFEGLKPREATKRSVFLSKASQFHPSGWGVIQSLFFIMGMLVLFIYGGLKLVVGIFGLREMLQDALAGNAAHDLLLFVLDALPIFLTILTLVPVWCVTTTILYFERRTRLEAYDIEALAKNMVNNAKAART